MHCRFCFEDPLLFCDSVTLILFHFVLFFFFRQMNSSLLLCVTCLVLCHAWQVQKWCVACSTSVFISYFFSSGPGNITTQWTFKVSPNNVLPEYPRPQLVRPANSWKNMNGLWVRCVVAIVVLLFVSISLVCSFARLLVCSCLQEFQGATQGEQPPFGRKLSGEILVPFPATTLVCSVLFCVCVCLC